MLCGRAVARPIAYGRYAGELRLHRILPIDRVNRRRFRPSVPQAGLIDLKDRQFCRNGPKFAARLGFSGEGEGVTESTE
jgi:hypothetical protein